MKRWTRKLTVLGMVAACALFAMRAACASNDVQPRLAAGFGMHRSMSEALLVGDSRPTPHGVLGGAVQCRATLWGLGIEARGGLAGAWHDYDNGNDETGNVQVLAPFVTLTFDYAMPIGSGANLEIGGMGEYSEVRSWAHSRILFIPFDAAGPRNIRRGGGVCARIAGRPHSRVMPFIEVRESALIVRAKDSSANATYRWLSYATEISFGFRFRVLSSKAVSPE